MKNIEISFKLNIKNEQKRKRWKKLEIYRTNTLSYLFFILFYFCRFSKHPSEHLCLDSQQGIHFVISLRALMNPLNSTPLQGSGTVSLRLNTFSKSEKYFVFLSFKLSWSWNCWHFRFTAPFSDLHIIVAARHLPTHSCISLIIFFLSLFRNNMIVTKNSRPYVD